MRPTPRLSAATIALASLIAEPAFAQDGPQPSRPPAEAPPQLDVRPMTPELKTPELKIPEPKTTEPNVPEVGPPSDNADRNPKGPEDRDAMLAELYAHLAQARDAEQAAPIARTIEGLWGHTGSPTIGLLMGRAYKAVNEQRPDLALKLLDAVVDLAPDYAEGWSRRAYVHYMQSNLEPAIGDLRRALALDPNHYKALEGLARILRESGQKKSALRAYQQLLRINPFLPGAKEAVDELTVEVEGQGI